MTWWNTQRHSERLLFIHIKDKSVTGALVLLRQDIAPLIVYTSKEILETANGVFKEGTLEALISRILSIGVPLLGDDRGGVDRVHIALSQPWYYSHTQHIHTEETTPFVIHGTYGNDLLAKELSRFEDELETEEDLEKGTYVVIENTLCNPKLNGYHVDNPIGKKTNVFDVSIYQSVATENLVHTVTKAVESHVHIPRISIHTFPVLFLNALNHILHTPLSDGLLVEVLEDMTSVYLVRDGVITFTRSVPSGETFIHKQIAKALDTTQPIAASLLELFLDEKLEDGDESQTIGEVLHNVGSEWRVYLEDVFLEIEKTTRLPGNIFLLAPTTTRQVYSSFLEEKRDLSLSVSSHTFTTTHITEETFASQVTIRPTVDHHVSLSLAVLGTLNESSL